MPEPDGVRTTALWDTGATKSVITRATAELLKLVKVGEVQVHHAGGISTSPTYIVNFLLPNKVGIVGLQVTECEDTGGNFGAIIGMDVIASGDFSITNVDGKTCMSFRLPSIETVDYVLAANNIIYANVGRNDPCPCGKTKKNGKPMKFKDCHQRELGIRRNF